MTAGEPDPLDPIKQFVALARDVFVLSLAMFAFSLGFQMTGRNMAEYIYALGLGALAVALVGTAYFVVSGAEFEAYA